MNNEKPDYMVAIESYWNGAGTEYEAAIYARLDLACCDEEKRAFLDMLKTSVADLERRILAPSST